MGLVDMGSRTGLRAVTILGDGESTIMRRWGVAGGSWGTETGVWVDDAAGCRGVEVGVEGVAGESTLGGSWVGNGGRPWGTGGDRADKEVPIRRHF